MAGCLTYESNVRFALRFMIDKDVVRAPGISGRAGERGSVGGWKSHHVAGCLTCNQNMHCVLHFMVGEVVVHC